MTRVPSDVRKLRLLIAAYTFVWVALYFPLETYVTWSIAGARGWLYSSYILNLTGMALMLWSAVSAMKAQSVAPALLVGGWAWTAATFWRATSDRFWWASEGRRLYVGPIELWLAIALTGLALAGFLASLLLAFRTAGAEPEGSPNSRSR